MIPRLLYSNLDLIDLTLDRKQTHYLKTVLRLESGDNLILFDGKGREAVTNFIMDSSGKIFLQIKERNKVCRETSINITVAQAMCLSKKMEFVIQKSTELGAKTIQPILTSRCQEKLQKNVKHEKLIRWQRIADAASAQCGRNISPKVMIPKDWKVFIGSANKKEDKATKWLLDPFSKQSISDANLDLENDLILTIGPEAGFSDQEEQMAIEKNFQKVRCGIRILRTETAPIVALSVINNRLNEM